MKLACSHAKLQKHPHCPPRSDMLLTPPPISGLLLLIVFIFDESPIESPLSLSKHNSFTIQIFQNHLQLLTPSIYLRSVVYVKQSSIISRRTILWIAAIFKSNINLLQAIWKFSTDPGSVLLGVPLHGWFYRFEIEGRPTNKRRRQHGCHNGSKRDRNSNRARNRRRKGDTVS